MRIAIGTCSTLPEPDPDQQLLLDALRAAGAEPVLLAWDDEAPIPTDLDLCVLRSTWTYYLDPERFLDWAERVASVTTLLNPVDVINWNHHKNYLAELEANGLPIIPTAFFDRGENASLESVMSDRSWLDVIIKPTVSASSFLTKRFTPETMAEGQQFLADLLQDRDGMIQPYMTEVDHSGERSLVWIDGEVTHSIRKSPRLADADESVSEALTPTPQETEFATRAMRGFETRCLYARIDVVRNDSGELCLSELELIEPSLFLMQHPPALHRLVNSMIREAQSARRSA